MKKIQTLSLLVICLTFGVEASDFSKKKMDVTEQVVISELKGDSVINLVEKQRMLIQKMSKELLHATNDSKDSEDNLIKTVVLFDKTLKGLISGDEDLALLGTSDKKILTQLKIIEKQWKPFKISIEKSNFKKIAKMNIPLLKSMNRAIEMYADMGNNQNVKMRAKDFDNRLNRLTRDSKRKDAIVQLEEVSKIDISNSLTNHPIQNPKLRDFYL